MAVAHMPATVELGEMFLCNSLQGQHIRFVARSLGWHLGNSVAALCSQQVDINQGQFFYSSSL